MPSDYSIPRYAIRGQIYSAVDERIQKALADIYQTAERPRCLCKPEGVDMYVCLQRHYRVKRMPDTGYQHHPACPSYAPDSSVSGLGELIGTAVFEKSAELVELKINFALSQVSGKSVARVVSTDAGGVAALHAGLSLRAVLHYLFDRAGLNRWFPAMAGKRGQGVVCKYLMRAAEEIRTKGVCLAQRLYVPEPFSEEFKQEIAQRRRARFCRLHTVDPEGRRDLMLTIAELKAIETTSTGQLVRFKHMAEMGFYLDHKTWARTEKKYSAILSALTTDLPKKPKVVCIALVRARQEYVYQIAAIHMMLATSEWIPLEGLYEIDLINALIQEQRRFIKPLRFDAKSGGQFASAILLDTGAEPAPLYVISEFMDKKDRQAREKIIKDGAGQWVWRMGNLVPQFPVTNYLK